MLQRQRLPKAPEQSVAENTVIKKKKPIVSEFPGVPATIKEIDLTSWNLPEEKNVPVQSLKDITTLIYGEQKIGKTTLASQFGEVLFFSFESGTNSQNVFATKPMTDWRQFLHLITQLESKVLSKENLKYDMACLDTGHAGYDRALEWICLRDGIIHPGKIKDYGASWKAVLTEFAAAHNRIVATGLGLIIISHSRIRDRDNREGGTYSRIEPCFSESAELYYKAVCDIVGYYHIISGKRYLLIQPEEDIVAGHRVDGRFLTTNGDPIYRIPMGNSKEEAFINLKEAFKNKQVKQNRIEELTGRIIKKRIPDDSLISSGTN